MQVANEFILYGGIFASLSLLAFHVYRVHKHYTWEKRSRALGYSLTKNDRFKNARTSLARAFKLSSRTEPVSVEEINSAIEHLPEVETHITDILGHWENMSLAIKKEIADDEVAFEMVASMVITYAYMFQQHIQHRRSDNERAYKYLEAVVDKWQKRLEHGEKAKSYEINFSSK